MPFLMREAVRSRLQKRVSDIEHGYRQNVGIVGSSGVGKTQLLCEFFQSVSRNPKLLPIYVKAETIDGRQLIEQWMGAALSSIMLDRTLNIPKTLSGLLREAEVIVPKTVAAVKHLQKLLRQDKNVFAVNGNDSVVRYVAQNPGSMGFVGLSYVSSDTDANNTGAFIPNVKVAAIYNDSTREYLQPYQAYIALRSYPLSRDLYYIKNETHNGLGTGFATFLTRDRGQLIFAHAHLFPLRLSIVIRPVELNYEMPKGH